MGHVFDEFKRNGISIPFQQVEVRERKDQVVYPVEFDELPERVEKVRNKNKKKTMTLEDMEDLTFTDIAASIKDAAANNKAKQKAKQKAKKEKEKKAKQEAKKEQK